MTAKAEKTTKVVKETQKKKSKRVKTPVVEKETFECEFCKKNFTTEKRLMIHMCEKKRRWLWRDEKYIKIGFIAYKKFYKLCMMSKKDKTYREFMDSRYFTTFTRFGKYLLDINAVEIEAFIEFLIKANVKIDDWMAEWAYETWVRELAKKESPEQAITRNILLMEQWSRETGEPWQDFFRKVSPVLATKWIKTGRISPWILYAGVGNQLFERMSDEQLVMVKDLINPLYWKTKVASHKEDMEYIEKILKDAGV